MDREEFEELLQQHVANCEKVHALQFSIRQLTDMQDQLLRENFVLLERLMEETRATRTRERNRARTREREREDLRESRRSGRARWNRLYYMAQQEMNNRNPQPVPTPQPEVPVTHSTLSSLFTAALPMVTSPPSVASSAASNSSATRATAPAAEEHSNLMFEYDIPLSQINNFMQMIQNLGEPVDVPLTMAEIEAATRTASYSSIVAPQNTTCPIQLDAFQDDDVVMMIRGCGHLFHRDALMHWFQRNHRCPMCRMDIRERT